MFAMMLPPAVLETRRRLGWTQAHLGARSGVSQSQVSRFEAQRIEVVSLSAAARFLDSMGIRATLTLDHPLVARSDRQRDAVHARCLAYVAGRIERMGWEVRREVEVQHGRSHGWIDTLAFHPPTRSALVIEVKSEIRDIGAVQRTVSWYVRMAWGLGRSLGWPIDRVEAAVLILATDANEARLAANAALMRQAFPERSAALSTWLNAPAADLSGPALALIDPRSRRARWLIATATEGRRSPLRYSSSADFLRRVRG